MSHPELSALLEGNAEWAKACRAQTPGFFKVHAESQNPKYLWFGCVDSRLLDVKLGYVPLGKILTHRNVANQIQDDDASAQAVLEFGLGALHIPNIVICGHTNCGGIRAACEHDSLATGSGLSTWLAPLAETYKKNEQLLSALDDTERFNKLAELNVIQQVEYLKTHPVVSNIWQEGKSLHIHGVMYDVASGTLSDLGVSYSGE